jgi:hypothetical protein
MLFQDLMIYYNLIIRKLWFVIEFRTIFDTKNIALQLCFLSKILQFLFNFCC